MHQHLSRAEVLADELAGVEPDAKGVSVLADDIAQEDDAGGGRDRSDLFGVAAGRGAYAGRILGSLDDDVGEIFRAGEPALRVDG